MAAPKKKRVVEVNDFEADNSSDGSGSEEEDLIDEDIDVNEIIQVDFEAHEPNGGDFDGIKRLLQQLFLKAHVDTSALTDIIIQQNFVGNVIKQSDNPEEDSDDDDEDITFGVTTVLNITERQDLPCIQQVRKLLLDQCRQHGSQECQHILENLLKKIQTDEFHVGFFINERLVNIPSKIAVPSFESLFKDLQGAIKRNQRFNFDNYILICKVYKLKTQKRGNGQVETCVYPKSEEEIFREEALSWFEYSIGGEADSGLEGEWDADDEGMEPFHQVLIIQPAKLDTILDKIKSIV